MQAGPATRQKGAAALEFVAVFMIFFSVFYGLVSYTLPMLMLQSFNQASSEAVRRCVALDPTSATYANDVQVLGRQVIRDQLAWMPLRWTSSLPATRRCSWMGDRKSVV